MRRAILLAASLTAVAAAAHAQPWKSGRNDGPPQPQVFISPAGEPFREGDGLQAWFNGADANHDGALTLDEMRGDFARYFAKLDADKNGLLDGFEIRAYERTVPEIAMIASGLSAGGMPGGRPRGRPVRIGPGPDEPPRISLLNIPQPVSNADEDVNGRVTAEEFSRAAKRRFGVLDKTQAGKLTLEALRPAARR